MKRLVWGAVASALLTFSCGGSADCVPVRLSCECDSLAGKSLVKGMLISLDSYTMSLEIEQVLNPDALLGEADVHRQEVGGLSQSQVCDRSRLEVPQAGESVFASFYAYGGRDPNAPLNAGDVLVLPWSEAVDVGNGIAMPVSEAVRLTDSDACEAQHPRPSAAPCKDTSSILNCSVSKSTQRSGSSSWLALALLGLAALVVRRERRRQ